MQQKKWTWRSLWRVRKWQNQGHSQEPGAALFQGLRMRLTLWYCAVLGVALVLFCVVLYLGARYFLLHPVDDTMMVHASMRAADWQRNGSSSSSSSSYTCSAGGPSDHFDHPTFERQPGIPDLTVCYDQHGMLIQNSTIAQLPAAFLTNNLAQEALKQGMAQDTIDAGGSTGLIARYALAVPDPHGSGSIGVVMTGALVGPQTDALSILLVLLLSVGGVTLLGAGLGGLFLANRALAPARLAFTRQQRFLADASHELRTPLTLMRADAEVLLRGRARLAEDDASLLEDIVAEAKHMSILASSMLTLARLDAGPQHYEREVVNLAELARQGVQRVAAFAEQKDVAIVYEAGDDALVIGDPTLLEQALLVLLDNAIKYNRPGGKVTVRASVDAGRALLRITDTGIGIAPEHLPHLSERFYRVDKARSREAGGAGLGLSIAHGIATQHHGILTLSSTPNQGTTATLQLPLANVVSATPA